MKNLYYPLKNHHLQLFVLKNGIAVPRNRCYSVSPLYGESSVDVFEYSKKTKHHIKYPKFSSATLQQQYNALVPIHVAPTKWQPHLINQNKLNDLCRDLNSWKIQSKLLGSRHEWLSSGLFLENCVDFSDEHEEKLHQDISVSMIIEREYARGLLLVLLKDNDFKYKRKSLRRTF